MSTQMGPYGPLAAGASHAWIFTWSSSGWQGNTFIQPQPLNDKAALLYAGAELVVCTIDSSGNPYYSFDYTVTNKGPNSTKYYLNFSTG